MEKNRFKYSICDDNISLSVKVHEASRKIMRMNHASIEALTDADEAFNRGIKRGDTILAMGDRPRFALVTTMPEDSLHPQLIKMGDLRIRIIYGDAVIWLDMADEIETVFHPHGTSYTIRTGKVPGVEFEVLLCQTETWGAVGKLSVKNCGEAPATISIELDYGGLTFCPRTYSANYCSDDTSEHAQGNRTLVLNDMAVLSDERVIKKAYAVSRPSAVPEFRDSRAVFGFSGIVEKDSVYTVYIIAGQANNEIDLITALSGSEPEKLIEESSSYYRKLLSEYSADTPVKTLNAGFMNAVLNLEYDYTYPAWYEGVHWWDAYWANNYQVSAAISLGQLDKARAALAFLADFENGPGPLVGASGRSADDTEDALPYYLQQLVQYYCHTGDAELCIKVWPKIKRAIEHLLSLRDSDKNYLLDWHMHCNGFLYQADHLGMPGDAASPSLMMAGMLERVSQVAFSIGKNEDGENWKAISDKIYHNVRKYLWNDEAGVFYNHIDNQGARHMAHYYTDMVFPVLYTSLDDKYKLRSMNYLTEALLFETEDDKRLLMRVGEFRPSVFGNNNVMPAQASEASRAYFKVGENDKGFELLNSVAISGTIHTEAPGNFPERMSDDGKGEANYIFGNPIGSFLHTFVDGLFGISVTERGETVRWTPAFPESWDHACIKLPYVRTSYKSRSLEKDKHNKNGKAIKFLELRLDTDVERMLDFEMLLNTSEVLKVLHDGVDADFSLCIVSGMSRISFRAEKAVSHIVSIEYAERSIKRHINWKNGNAKLKLEQPWYDKIKTEAREVEFANARLIDITKFFNADKIRTTAPWRGYEISIDLARYGYTVRKDLASIAGMPVAIAADDEGNGARMVLLEYGKSHKYDGSLTEYPGRNSVEIEINETADKLMLLYASEAEPRNTGSRVGAVNLMYDDGLCVDFPLVAGRNFDTIFSHFAVDTIPVKVGKEDYINALVLPCRTEAVLNRARIEIELADNHMGLIGLTVSRPAAVEESTTGVCRQPNADVEIMIQETAASAE